MEALMAQWWLWSVAAGSLLLVLGGVLRRRGALAAPVRPAVRNQNTGVIVMSADNRQPLPELNRTENSSIPGFPSNLPEVVAELNQQQGLAAWRIKQRELAKRRRETAVVEGEIQAAKKRIEYIRTLAEQSSVVDEERLRIAKLKQEMRRLEQEEARAGLEDQVANKRLEKELAELERAIRDLGKEEPVPRPKSEAEKRQEALQREAEKQAFEVAMQTLKAQQGLAARQALLEAMNQEIEKIRQNRNLSAAQQAQLIEDVEDYYQDLIARAT